MVSIMIDVCKYEVSLMDIGASEYLSKSCMVKYRGPVLLNRSNSEVFSLP